MDAQAATVFVVDDDFEVRDGLSRLLRSAGLGVVAHASAQEFLAGGPYAGTACVLLDVDMPGMTGPQLQDHLRGAGVALPVIYLTGKGSVPIGIRAMKQGAIDFLEKPVDADVLLPAIERALAAYRTFQEGQRRVGDIAARLASLTRREREVLDLVVAGRMNKQIAGDLAISEKTVKIHRGRAMTKMRCRSVAEVVHLCDELGFAGGR